MPSTSQPVTPAPDQNPTPAPDQNPAPAPDQNPAPASSVPPAPALGEPVDDPATSLRDGALAQLGLGMAARNIELSSGPAGDPEQGTEPLSERGLATLAGASALAAAGYRVLLGRSDRIKRRWPPGRFM
jgi:hypothetical protein